MPRWMIHPRIVKTKDDRGDFSGCVFIEEVSGPRRTLLLRLDEVKKWKFVLQFSRANGFPPTIY